MFLRQAQEAADVILEEMFQHIPEDQWDDALRSLRIHHPIREIVLEVASYVVPHKEKLFKYLTPQDIEPFGDVIDFSECGSLPEYIRLLKNLHKTYQNLRAKSLYEFLDNCQQALAQENQNNGLPDGLEYPYLNWCPGYGGIISLQYHNNAKFRKWAIDHNLTYFADSDTLVKSPTQEFQSQMNMFERIRRNIQYQVPADEGLQGFE